MINRKSTFSLQCVHPDTVERILCCLKNSKSFGMDSIDTYALKLAGPYILPVITHLINLSIVKTKFPSDWKIAKVIPLHKKDDPLDPKNFRPVAILPILIEIREKVVFLQVVDYMEANDFMNLSHQGFRANQA